MRLLRRGLAVLGAGIESVARAARFDRAVALKELQDPWVDVTVDERIVVRLGWHSPPGPPCVCPVAATTATLTGARLVRVERGGVKLRARGEVPVPGLDCVRVMTFWFEATDAWASLAAARLVIEDGSTAFELTAHRPGAVGTSRVIAPTVMPMPRGGWVTLGAAVEGHTPGRIFRLGFEQGGVPRFDDPVALQRTDGVVQFCLPRAWHGRGTVSVAAAMLARVSEVRGVRVQQFECATNEALRFVVELAG